MNRAPRQLQQLFRTVQESLRIAFQDLPTRIRDSARGVQPDCRLTFTDGPGITWEMIQAILTSIPKVVGRADLEGGKARVKVNIYPSTNLHYFKMADIRQEIGQYVDATIQGLKVGIKHAERPDSDDGLIYVLIAQDTGRQPGNPAKLGEYALRELADAAREAMAYHNVAPGTALKLQVWDEPLADELAAHKTQALIELGRLFGGAAPKHIDICYDPTITWTIGPALKIESIFSEADNPDDCFKTPRNDETAGQQAWQIELVGTLTGSVFRALPSPAKVTAEGASLAINRAALITWFGQKPYFMNASNGNALRLSLTHDGHVTLDTKDGAVWALIAMKTAPTLEMRQVLTLDQPHARQPQSAKELYIACNVLRQRPTAVLRLNPTGSASDE